MRGSGKIVFLSNFVQTTVIDTHAHGSILLFDEKNGGTKRACGGAYVSMCKVFFDLSLCLFEFVRCLAIESSWGNFVVWDEINGMVDSVSWGFVRW